MRRRDFIIGASGLLLPAVAHAQFGVPADLGIAGPLVSTTSTFDPANKGASIVLSNGNLTATRSGGPANNSVVGTLSHSSGKWYFEIVATQCTTEVLIGLSDSTFSFLSSYLGSDANGWGYDQNGGPLWHDAGTASFAGGVTTLYTTGDVIGVAADITNGKMWWSKNGTFLGTSADPAAGTGSAFTFTALTTLFPAATVSGSSDIVTARFGSGNSFSPPSGFSLWG